MTCISRRPRCGTVTASVIPEPLTDIISLIGVISGIVGVVVGIFKGFEIGWIATIGGTAAAAGLASVVTSVAIVILIGTYVVNRCERNPSEGTRECVSGAINEVVQDFSGTLEEFLPFTAMHDRVDVIVKSSYWDVVEDGQAKVFCTDVEPPRRSEILRCYFFTARVCNAAQGSMIGAAVGGTAAIAAGMAAAVAIGCATVILCLLALIVAVLIVAVAALVGSLIGGQIAKAASTDTSPTASDGTTLAVGNLITVRGRMTRREYDEEANVLYFASNVSLMGNMPSGFSPPFSYCDVDDQISMDTCG